MDQRLFYPDYFYVKSRNPNSPARSLAWKERNGYGFQPLMDVGTDMATNFLYKEDFERCWLPCSEEESKECVTQVEKNITERGGVQHEVPNYTYTTRNQWS